MFRAILVGVLAACVCAASAENVAEGLSVAAPDGSTFRFDYRFYPSARGWLKLHRTSASWHSARLQCRLEGARLASPLDQGFYSTLRQLLRNSTLKSVYTGINGKASSTDYFSIEGVHITNMPLEWEGQKNSSRQGQQCLAMNENGLVSEADCSYEKPFFCYKPVSALQMNSQCGTTDPAYRWDARTGSCYKFHNIRMTWYQGQITCAAEGGHLIVINSVEESQIITDLARGSADYVMVGMFNWYKDDGFDQNVWTTTQDQTLAEAGFDVWLPSQPDNWSGVEYCGSIGWTNRNVLGYNDIGCYDSRPFICEIPRPRVPLWW